MMRPGRRAGTLFGQFQLFCSQSKMTMHIWNFGTTFGGYTMATRSNALSEIARFWLQECHGLFIRESVPVKLTHNNSDIDFAATTPQESVTLLDRITFKNAIIESKDERDFDPKGNDFLKRLNYDISILGSEYIEGTQKCNFSMLKEQHHKKATEIFGGEDFVKLFIFHNIKITDDALIGSLARKKIFVIKSGEMLGDILNCLKTGYQGASVRNSLVGDILDMLIRYHKWGPLPQ